MEDDLDPDTYEDDFSESEPYPSIDQEDDEQLTQKVSLLKVSTAIFVRCDTFLR